MFYLFAAVILTFSVLTVTSRKVLRAAVYLLFVLITTSALYYLLDYLFLAAVQLTLYAGGIVVLIIFSILLTSHISQSFPTVEWKKGLFSALSVLVGALLAISTILDFNFKPTSAKPVESTIDLIGKSMLNYGADGYVLPFEAISILLLAAMFGAIVIAKKQKI